MRRLRKGASPAGTPESVAHELRALGYEVLDQVGRGSYATVWRARQPRFDRDVAVKVLDVEVRDAAAERRFARECAVMGRLTGHPHVVTVLDAGVTPSGRAHIVMDYFSGGSLGGALAAHGPLPAEAVVRHGGEVADGLQAAHDAGVLHRDLKPENVLLSRFGQAALADFGISLELEQRRSLAATQTALTLTPLHASPEVLDGAAGGVASDVYSLCSTLYTLLAGRTPYPVEPGEGVLQFVYRVMSGNVPRLDRDDLPAGLEALLRAGLAADPAARPPSAAVLREELGRLGTARAGGAGGVGGAGGPRVLVEPPAAGEAAREAGSQAGQTRLRPDAVVAAPVAAPSARPGWLLPLLSGGAAVLVGGGVALVVVSTGGGDGAAPAPSPAPVASALPGPPPLVPTPPVEVGTTLVPLSWTPGTVGAPTTVRVYPADGSAAFSVAAAPGATSVAVPVQPSLGYCFRVFEVVQLPGAPASVGTGDTCIRGASIASQEPSGPAPRP